MTDSAGVASVLFVSQDPFLEARVRRARTGARRGGGGFRLLLAREFDPRSDVALFILPAALANTILAPDGRLALPVLAYGPEQSLAAALLRGCVDYLRDPWTLTELELRVNRWLEARLPARRFGGLWLQGTTLHGPTAAVPLSAVEARLLEMLLHNAGRVTSRDALFYRLWGRLPTTPSRVVDVHVASLRRKCRTALSGSDAADGDGARSGSDAAGGGDTAGDDAVDGGTAGGDVALGGAGAASAAGSSGVTITAVRGEGYLLAITGEPG